jgi:hypothetical protein
MSASGMKKGFEVKKCEERQNGKQTMQVFAVF